MAEKLTSIEVPVTESELRRLAVSAILTGTGMAWEAFRLQAGLPRLEELLTQIEVDTPMVKLPYEYAEAKIVIRLKSASTGDELLLFDGGEILLCTDNSFITIDSNLFQEFIRALDKHCIMPVFDDIRDAAYQEGYQDAQEEKPDDSGA